jgi:type I restriction enzyme S subunit
MVIIETERIDRAFLLHLLNSPLVRKQAIRMSSGSTFSRVNLGDIRSYQIPVPEKEVQERIGEVLATVEEQIISKESYLEQVRRLKRGLMQDLLSGEVHTAQCDIDLFPEVEKYD